LGQVQLTETADNFFENSLISRYKKRDGSHSRGKANRVGARCKQWQRWALDLGMKAESLRQVDQEKKCNFLKLLLTSIYFQANLLQFDKHLL
jgi:hypothetical protein